MEKIAASIAQIAAQALLEAGGASRDLTAELPEPVATALKAWVADQPEPRPSLSEAVGRGLSEWLAGKGYLPPPA